MIATLNFCRSPSWGAWIEIDADGIHAGFYHVAPPRGERGLKLRLMDEDGTLMRRSPSWGAWIEILLAIWDSAFSLVAPPRGERGLKSLRGPRYGPPRRVAPPRGERGLKSVAGYRVIRPIRRSPSWGAWIEMHKNPPL